MNVLNDYHAMSIYLDNLGGKAHGPWLSLWIILSWIWVLKAQKLYTNKVEPGPNIETVKNQGWLIATMVSEDLALL